jgi:hypothetical protein
MTRRIPRIAMAAFGAWVLGGCGGTSTPTAPQPGPGQGLSLMSAVPGPGAILGVRECPTANTRPLCTRDVVLTVAATYDRPLALGSVFVEFFTPDGRRCAAGSSPSGPMSPGVERVFEVFPTYVSFPPNQGLLCPLPVTTTRMDVILVDVSTAEFRRVLIREVPGTYTFRMAE